MDAAKELPLYKLMARSILSAQAMSRHLGCEVVLRGGPPAGTWVELRGKRVGHDLEFYALKCLVSVNDMSALLDFVGDIIFEMRSLGLINEYHAAMKVLRPGGTAMIKILHPNEFDSDPRFVAQLELWENIVL